MFRAEFWRLNIRLHNSKISKWLADKRVLSSAALQHQINLKQLISPDGSIMSGIAKMTLSVFLAYSIFYLYGGSWTRGGWKRENIMFFRGWQCHSNAAVPQSAFTDVIIR